MENDDVDLDELIAKKDARRRRRLEKLKAKQAGLLDTESSSSPRRGRRPNAPDVSSSTENHTPRKRGRPRRTDTEVRIFHWMIIMLTHAYIKIGTTITFEQEDKERARARCS